MKNLLLAMLACGFLSASWVAEAKPIDYSIAYAASSGPNGAGSFSFDDESGALTGFGWKFDDGAAGGLADFLFGMGPGDTFGKFMIELLTQSDLSASADCLAPNSCRLFSFFDGAGPLDSLGVSFTSRLPGVTDYAFYSSPFDFADTNIVTRGVATISAVPEPGPLVLLACALLGLGLMPRRRAPRT